VAGYPKHNAWFLLTGENFRDKEMGKHALANKMKRQHTFFAMDHRHVDSIQFISVDVEDSAQVEILQELTKVKGKLGKSKKESFPFRNMSEPFPLMPFRQQQFGQACPIPFEGIAST